MKITFVNYKLGICGRNRTLFEIANRLIDNGDDVLFVAQTDQKWFPLKAEIIKVPNPQDMAKAIPESDFVVATWCQTIPIVDSVKDKTGIPVYYCQQHEPIYFIDPQMKKMVARTYKMPFHLITNSPWLEAIIKSEYNRESTIILPGVDQNLFKPKRRKKKKTNTFKVGVFSSRLRFKGFYDTTLPALRYLTRHYNATEVHIIGDNLPIPYKINFIHHKRVSDKRLAKFYNEIDVFVSGSHIESSPLPHLEAMACGCPVVSTMFGNEHYGDSILRVIPKAPRRLGETLKSLALNRGKLVKMRKQGLEDVKPFTWTRTAESLQTFFKYTLESV
jgi:glycosyltransferase involved in cell wall biosynthesis